MNSYKSLFTEPRNVPINLSSSSFVLVGAVPFSPTSKHERRVCMAIAWSRSKTLCRIIFKFCTIPIGRSINDQ